MRDAVKSAHNQADIQLNRLKAVICASLLLQPTDRSDSVQSLRASACGKLVAIRWIIDEAKHIEPEKYLMQSKLFNTALKMNDVCILSHLASQTDAQLQLLFRQELEYPLLTALAHLYSFYIMSSGAKIERLDRLCLAFEKLLFWNGRPRNLEELVQSLRKWVAPVGGPVETAMLISMRRQRQTSLLFDLFESDFAFTHDIRQRHLKLPENLRHSGVREQIVQLLTEELLSYPNQRALVQAILGTLTARVGEAMKENKAAMWMTEQVEGGMIVGAAEFFTQLEGRL